MGTYPPRGRWLYVRSPANQRSACGAGVSTPCGAVSTRGITVFVPRLSESYMYGGISDPGMVPCRPRVALALFSSPSQSASGRRGWGFHTVRGGFDPGDHRFRRWVVGVVDVWRDFGTGDGDLSSPGTVRSWGFPEGQLPPRASRLLSGQGQAGGGASANGSGARKTLG